MRWHEITIFPQNGQAINSIKNNLSTAVPRIVVPARASVEAIDDIPPEVRKFSFRKGGLIGWHACWTRLRR
ncbi:MAG: hypothetical protein ABIR47_05710, partial [Candidatus Kapaibacterium sp.]